MFVKAQYWLHFICRTSQKYKWVIKLYAATASAMRELAIKDNGSGPSDWLLHVHTHTHTHTFKWLTMFLHFCRADRYPTVCSGSAGAGAEQTPMLLSDKWYQMCVKSFEKKKGKANLRQVARKYMLDSTIRAYLKEIFENSLVGVCS